MSEIVNADRLLRKFRSMASDKVGQDIVLKGVKNSIKMVQGEAKLLAPVGLVAGGELRQSIKTRAEMATSNLAVGQVFVATEHGIYVELGTGPKGSASHVGVSPNVSVAYRSSPWYVHESDIDPAVAEAYHFAKRGDFYKMYGQPAQPYLYPALKNNEARVKKNISQYVQRKLREVASQ